MEDFTVLLLEHIFPKTTQINCSDFSPLLIKFMIFMILHSVTIAFTGNSTSSIRFILIYN